MYINFTFIEYMCAICTGIISISILVSVFVTKSFERTKLLKTFLFFSIVSFLFVLLYFVFYYREKVLQLYELVLPWRVADSIICGLLFFALILLINTLGDPLSQFRQNKNSIVLTGAISVVWIMYSSFATVMFMDSYYYIIDPSASGTLPIIEIIIVVILIISIKYSMVINFRIVSLALTRKYIVVISVLLSLLLGIQAIVNYNLYLGRYRLSAWENEIPDLTGLIFSIVNIATIIFILKTDFTPIYIAGNQKNYSESSVVGEPDTESLLDLTAEKYRLTHREREIIELVYEGYSNPDIAKHLFISNNTVKRHMRHIFEKLDVSARIEMIHLINSQNPPIG